MFALRAGPGRLRPGEGAGGGHAQSPQCICVEAAQLAGGGQDPGGGALPQAEEPQQQVLGVHPPEAGAEALGGRQLHRLPAVGGEAVEGETDGAAAAAEPTHLLLQALGGEAGGPEELGGGALSLPAEAQQQMLGAHIAVAQVHRRALGQLQGRLGPLGESVFSDGPSPRFRLVPSVGGLRRPWARLWAAPSSSGVRAPESSTRKRSCSFRICSPPGVWKAAFRRS